MLRIVEPDDAAWSSHFRDLPREQQDIFYCPEYVELAARYIHRGGRPLCALFESGSTYLMYPFLERAIEFAGTVDYRDITGVYGRGGVVGRYPTAAETIRFHDALRAYCRDRRIVCGFDRYHPILRNERMASSSARVFDVGGFVVVDLRPPLGEIERRFKHAVRKSIKKAERAGCEVFSEATGAHLDDFLEVYAATLDRNRAREFYYVDPEFYREIQARLEGRYRFFYTAIGGKIVSCELVLIQGLYCHSFLGGSREDFRDACPNHLLKREIIRFARSVGCLYYLLGGGPTPYDGIWDYKRGFAPDGSLPSTVGGTIFDAEAYEALRGDWQSRGAGDERFQFYDTE